MGAVYAIAIDGTGDTPRHLHRSAVAERAGKAHHLCAHSDLNALDAHPEQGHHHDL